VLLCEFSGELCESSFLLHGEKQRSHREPQRKINDMKLKELVSYLNSAVPLSLQESYDNSGLQVGLPDTELTSALISLDVTEEVLDEAIALGCNLILSHHPLIFRGIKSLAGRSLTEKIIYKAVKCDIAVYSSHTNLDIIANGVSRKMAEKLNLKEVKVLAPLTGRLLKLVVFIPDSHLERVKNAVFEAGAGITGNYDMCGFTSSGSGSFRGNKDSDPFVGEKGKLHFENETRFETVLYSHLREKVVSALLESHPYEEVAYDLYSLENTNIELGLGCTGDLPASLTEEEFLDLVSGVFGAKGIRYSKLTGKRISKVALCGGSGSSLIKPALALGADVFLTADLKYHNFFEAENMILLVDAGHFETEKFSTEVLKDLIIKKFPKFAVRFSETNTNPINYL
jgi:dinuclear metal center YbgI/SA1388 family protein